MTDTNVLKLNTPDVTNLTNIGKCQRTLARLILIIAPVNPQIPGLGPDRGAIFFLELR